MRCPSVTLALPSLELPAQVRPNLAVRTPRNGFALMQQQWRQEQFWETVGFGALGLCGATTTVLAVLRIVAVV